MRPYILAETNWEIVRNTQFDLAVLPWGATEAHNYHLPYATDNYQVDFVLEKAAEKAWQNGTKALIMPCIPFGVNTGQMDIPFCINLNPSTQYAIIKDVAEVLRRAGIRKFVIMNGHGGNHFKQMLRELSIEYPDIFACAGNWYQAEDPAAYFTDLGDHAGELETSVMQVIRPDLVQPLSQAGNGHAKQWTIEALRKGWVSSQRQWSKVTADTGVGDPSQATAERGERFLAAVIDNVSQFFQELADADVDQLYT
ncbi:MAG: creatininase family protein [Bacteroidota bacterium]